MELSHTLDVIIYHNYAIPAIFFILLAIIPTLFLPFNQFSWFQKILQCLKIDNQLIIMDSIQGCYKNGTEPNTRDYRWFAAVPLIGRGALLVVYAITLDNTTFPYIAAIILYFVFHSFNGNHSTIYCINTDTNRHYFLGIFGLLLYIGRSSSKSNPKTSHTNGCC